MQTNFEVDRLKDPDLKRSNEILRACVHCGLCTATCPTYQILGDELDSPRGRIYLIKDMLENNRNPDEKTVKHIDRCLSCFSCMTTCPSGVNYMHLLNHARSYIEKNYNRRLGDRFLRGLLTFILPFPRKFRLALIVARLFVPFRRFLPGARLRAMLSLIPRKISVSDELRGFQSFPPKNKRLMRVALLKGCVQSVLDKEISNAAIRLLNRLGCEVIVTAVQGCCGALSHHMGKNIQGHSFAENNIKSWIAERESGGLDAVVVTTSGCGTHIKDYGHMFRSDALSKDARIISDIALDITELLNKLDVPANSTNGITVGYHAACSLQHGQKIISEPKNLLTRVGFRVVEPLDSHICCGSAGTYNLLEPAISEKLKQKKVDSIMATEADIVAAGNIGCISQISSGITVPVVHTVQLIDWATGGPVPEKVKTLLVSKNIK